MRSPRIKGRSLFDVYAINTLYIMTFDELTIVSQTDGDDTEGGSDEEETDMGMDGDAEEEDDGADM